MDLSYFHDTDSNLRTFTNWHSEDSLSASAKLHKGACDDVLQSLHDAWQESLQWQWYSQYQAWLIECEKTDEENASLMPYKDDATGEKVEPEYKEKPPMPVRPSIQSWDTWCAENYAFLRECAYPSIKEQLGMQYDDIKNGSTLWLDMQERIKAQYPKPAKTT